MKTIAKHTLVDTEKTIVDTDHQPKNRLDKWIFTLGNGLSLLFILTVGISFYEVVMRYVFNAPTIWVHETASFIGGALFVFGGSYALAINKHVRVVLVYDSVSPRIKSYLNIFHHIMGLMLTAMLCFAAYQMASSSWITPWGSIQAETSGSAWNPAFPAYLKAIILLTVSIMFIQFCLHLVAEIQSLRKRDHV